MLSGFVIGYAYDNRWKTMTTREFIKRRLIRLAAHGSDRALIGALIFYFQGCPVWDVSQVAVISLFAATFVNILLIPSPPGMEIRGLGEMYPLNGPSWSLFFEYIGKPSLCPLHPETLYTLPGNTGCLGRVRPCLLQLLGA